MTKEITVLEGNKLIAEFMGAKGQQWYPESDMYNLSGVHYEYPTSGIYPDNVRHHSDQLLKYHTSWDWLMPVVEKIESIVDKHHGHFAVYIGSNGCTIQATNFRPDKPIPDPPHYFADYTYETKIKATWQAVTEFIQWYNQQNIKI